MASLAGAFAAVLLASTALTPANAGDMTFERALNVDKEPHNWLLHHGNYQGHRFSHLKEINTDTAKNLKVAETVEQKDRIEQGGTVKPRDRFAGGAPKTNVRLYGSLKGVDPATGETKVALKLEYPNISGALATAGNLVFLGHYDGTISAYDAKTLKEAWSFNVGTPMQAPAMSYSVNGKQYVAVLVGARMPPLIMQNAPELKNMTTSSTLYVFALQ
jgi:glucose dehydrogenase